MAVSGNKAGFRERGNLILGPLMLTFCTLGLALPITLPLMVYRVMKRDKEANTFRCPQCGNRVK